MEGQSGEVQEEWRHFSGRGQTFSWRLGAPHPPRLTALTLASAPWLPPTSRLPLAQLLLPSAGSSGLPRPTPSNLPLHLSLLSVHCPHWHEYMSPPNLKCASSTGSNLSWGH